MSKTYVARTGYGFIITHPQCNFYDAVRELYRLDEETYADHIELEDFLAMGNHLDRGEYAGVSYFCMNDDDYDDIISVLDTNSIERVVFPNDSDNATVMCDEPDVSMMTALREYFVNCGVDCSELGTVFIYDTF